MSRIGFHHTLFCRIGDFDTIWTYHNIFDADNALYVRIKMPGKQNDLGISIYQRQQFAKYRSVNVFVHTLVVLMNDEFIPEQFAQKSNRGVLDKTFAVAGKSNVA